MWERNEGAELLNALPAVKKGVVTEQRCYQPMGSTAKHREMGVGDSSYLLQGEVNRQIWAGNGR